MTAQATRVGARVTDVVTLTIANGASLSDALDMRDYAGGVMEIPSLAGHIHFKVSSDGVTYNYLYDEYMTLVTISPATVAGAVVLPAKLFAGFWMKIQTDTTATGTNAQTQSAAKTIKVMLKS